MTDRRYKFTAEGGMCLLYAVYKGIIIFLDIVSWTIILDMLLSWILSPFHRARVILNRITGPIIQPFRSIMRRILGGRVLMIDFSPLLAYFAIQILRNVVGSIFGWFA